MVITVLGRALWYAEEGYWSEEKGGLSCPWGCRWEPRLRWDAFLSNEREEGDGCQRSLEVELIHPSMNVRVEKTI